MNPPQLKRGNLWAWGLPAERTENSQAPIQLVRPFPAPELRVEKLQDGWAFLICSLSGPVLRDTARLSQRYPPSLRAMGFLVSQHGQLGAIPPPPFLSVSPLESMRSGNKESVCDTPLCDTISKGYCAI